MRSTRPQHSRSVCSGNSVLCARKYGFVGCFGRCEQLLVATRSSFSKGALQNDICRFESYMPSQAVLVFGTYKRWPRNRPRFRGILAVRLSLRAPFGPHNGQGAPEISGGTLKYSQFSELHAGDWFDFRLPGRGGTDFIKLASENVVYCEGLAAGKAVCHFEDNR